MGIVDYGSANSSRNNPSVAAWAASVAAVLDNSDTSVNTRLASYARVTVSSVAPSSPTTGDIWLDTGDAWTSYTPTLGAWTTGNGTASGRWTQIGKTVIFTAKFIFGSTSAAASSIPTLTLPATAQNTDLGANIVGFFEDVGVNRYRANAYIASTTTAALTIIGTSGIATTPSTTTPFTWVTGDILHVGGTYEAA